MQKNNSHVIITIPSYNLGEHSLPLLERCLQSIRAQDYPNILVVVSDHSKDNEIHDYLYEEDLISPEDEPYLELVYHKFDDGKQGKSGVGNMNNAWEMAYKIDSKAYIKSINQDDYLSSPVTITRMVDAIQSEGKHWCVVGCNHVDENNNDINYNHSPRWVEGFQLAYGLNHIGSHSVIMFKPTALRQDVHLTYLNDCDWYYRMSQAYGPPALINDMLVTIAMREGGLSNQLDLDVVKAREQRYVQKKYGVI